MKNRRNFRIPAETRDFSFP